MSASAATAPTTAPASLAQLRLWFTAQLAGEEPLYTISLAWRLRGRLDVVALRRALQRIGERHSVLRTDLRVVDGELVQEVHPHVRFDIEVVEVPARPDRVAAARAMARQLAARPFDLTRAPLLRAQLLRLGEDDAVLLIAVHHLVFDGLSVGVLGHELDALYAQSTLGQPPELPDPSMQYAEFARAQRASWSGADHQAEVDFWRELLADVPPTVELPLLRNRSAAESLASGYVAGTVDGEVWAGLRRLCSEARCTPFVALVSAYAALLHRCCGAAALRIATPSAGRRGTRLEALIGMFVNTLLLPFRFTATMTFRDLLRQARTTSLQALAHEDVPLDRVLDALEPARDRAAPSLQLAFTYQPALGDTLRLAGLSVEPLEVDSEVCEFDLALTITDRGDRLECGMDYRRELLDGRWVAQLLELYTILLRAVVADPDARLRDLDLVTPDEHAALLELAAGPDRPYPRDATIDELFRAHARRDPEAIAVRTPDRQLSYRDLDRAADAVAHALHHGGVNAGDVVGVCARRDPLLLAGLLGVLRLGAVYLPLDPDSPGERLAFMLDDARASVVLAHRDLREVLPPGQHRTVVLDDIDVTGDPSRVPPVGALGRGTGESAAYLIYTSGSTGRPKGVLVPHRGVVHLVAGADYADFGAGTTFLQLSPLSFDASVIEVWGPLLSGGTIALAPDRAAFMHRAGHFLRQLGATAAVLISPQFHVIVDRDPTELAPLRFVLVGGDVLSADHLRRALAALPGTRFAHCYGPTESTVLAGVHQVRSVPASAIRVAIGRPIAHSRAYVVDERLRLVPRGTVGELCVGGDGIALGYSRRPALSAAAFVPDPYAPAAGARMYRTGDLVRMGLDGELEFLGRIDAQLKVRGFRVEPGEIEAVLMRHPDVRTAAVVGSASRQQLVGYVVPATYPAEPALPGRLRDWIRRHLPDHMVPSAVVVVERLPLTPNGKLDRTALPAPVEAPAVAVDETSWTATQRLLAQLWREVLDVPAVGLDDNFFDLGGDSLGVLGVLAELRRRGVTVPLQALYKAQTVRAAALYLDREAPSEQSTGSR
jgi:aspartate racemase